MDTLFANQGNVALALTTKTFAAMGFTDANISIVYETGAALKSWVPGRSINGITGITLGKGYWIIPKTNINSEDLATDIESVILTGTGQAIVYP